MKKKLLVTATAAAVLMAGSAHAMDAKRAGQGFTDIMGDYTNAASNPALMTKFGADDDFHLSQGLGVHLADEGDAIDEAEAAQDLIDDFNADPMANITPENIEKFRSHLRAVSEEPMYLREGVSLSLAIPNSYLSTSFFVKQQGRVGVLGDYQDDAYLDALLNDPMLYQTLGDAGFQSQVRAAGYSVTDAGFSFGHEVATESIPFLTSLGLGTNVKYQRLDLLTYAAGIQDFEEGDMQDEGHEHDSGLNVDFGAVMTFDEAQHWTGSIVAQDLIKNSVENQHGDTFETDTRVTVGGGYQGDLFSVVAQADVTEHGELGDVLAPVQYASLGAEFNMWDHAALRAGYRTDLNNVEDDVVTAGIGISPFNIVSLDLAVFAGSGDNLGAVVQTGLRF